MSRSQFIIFAKAPRPGLVKTRLCPPLSMDQAATLYAAMLGDVLETSAAFVRNRDLEGILALHPIDAAADIAPRLPREFRIHAQRGGDLGARMANAFAEGAASGTPWVLLRGSDSPGLGLRQMAEAMDRLEAGDDLVLIPDQGGGYAMIGLREPRAELFEMPMSTAGMLEQTIRLAADAGLATSTLGPTLDLDTAGDLIRFTEWIREQGSDSCPRTVEAIESLTESAVL